jgi:hypothetical protein
MSAGCGLKHEEYNIGEEEVNFLQIWIQPKLQNITPRYQTRSFPRDKRKNSLVTIVTGEEGFDHCWINQNAKLTLGYFDKSRDTEYTFDSFNKCLFVFVISGGLKINDAILGKRDAIGIWDTERVLINCFDNTEFLIVEVPVNQK